MEIEENIWDEQFTELISQEFPALFKKGHFLQHK